MARLIKQGPKRLRPAINIAVLLGIWVSQTEKCVAARCFIDVTCHGLQANWSASPPISCYWTFANRSEVLATGSVSNCSEALRQFTPAKEYSPLYGPGVYVSSASGPTCPKNVIWQRSSDSGSQRLDMIGLCMCLFPGDAKPRLQQCEQHIQSEVNRTTNASLCPGQGHRKFDIIVPCINSMPPTTSSAPGTSATSVFPTSDKAGTSTTSATTNSTTTNNLTVATSSSAVSISNTQSEPPSVVKTSPSPPTDVGGSSSSHATRKYFTTGSGRTTASPEGEKTQGFPTYALVIIAVLALFLLIFGVCALRFWIRRRRRKIPIIFLPGTVIQGRPEQQNGGVFESQQQQLHHFERSDEAGETVHNTPLHGGSARHQEANTAATHGRRDMPIQGSLGVVPLYAADHGELTSSPCRQLTTVNPQALTAGRVLQHNYTYLLEKAPGNYSTEHLFEVDILTREELFTLASKRDHGGPPGEAKELLRIMTIKSENQVTCFLRHIHIPMEDRVRKFPPFLHQPLPTLSSQPNTTTPSVEPSISEAKDTNDGVGNREAAPRGCSRDMEEANDLPLSQQCSDRKTSPMSFQDSSTGRETSV